MKIHSFWLYILSLVLLFGCSKNDVNEDHSNHVPTIITAPITSITYNGAQSGGNITNDGGSTPSGRGVCYGTNHNPSLNDIVANNLDGGGIGSYITQLTNLNGGTTYYVRAFATNNAGVGYGNEISFKTNNTPLYIVGQRFGGGIIFYVDSTGNHGLIFDTTDIIGPWTNNNVQIHATSFDDGENNTSEIILNSQDTGRNAAEICHSYNGGGYNDWFLPAMNQLNVFCGSGLFNFPEFAYWSSTENGSTTAYALYIHGPNKGMELSRSKQNGFGIIPIRKF